MVCILISIQYIYTAIEKITFLNWNQMFVSIYSLWFRDVT